MIKLICGRESNRKNDRVLEFIKDSFDRGHKVCVIVPEQQAVVWERRLARELDPAASLDLDVVSFTRLANLAERKYGGLAYNYADRGARTLLMWKAISAAAPFLRVYGDARNTANTVAAMQSAHGEFSAAGISPEDLSRTAEILESEGESSLSDRLYDLSLIMAEYSASFEGKYDDPGSEAEKLLSILREHDFFADTDVFIDSFYSLTAVETKIAREIFSQAANTYMTFACPDSASEGEPHLEHIRKFYVSMKEYAAACGDFSVEEIDDGGDLEVRDHLRKNLWNYAAPPYEGEAGDFLTLIRCADRYDEAEAVLCRVRELISAGAKYSDIAVISRSVEGRIGVLDTVFAEAGVPLSVSVRFSLMSSPLINFAMSALYAVRSGYSRDDVCAVVKSGLTDITEEESAAFCRYTRVWNITGKHAYDAEEWTMNPDGYTAKLSPRAADELALANSAKAKIENILSPLECVFREGGTVGDILSALWESLSRSGAYSRLCERAKALYALGYKDAAAFLRRSWDELMASLDTFYDILGDIKTDASVFSSLLKQVICARDVGVIPAGIDEVIFGAADRLRCDRVSHVIVIGALDGEFPLTPSESGIFTDSDRIRLEGAGLVLSDYGEDRSEQELFWFWRACAMAERTLDVIVPETDGAKKTQPSSGARRLEDLFPKMKRRYFSPDDPIFALWRREDAERFLNYADAENSELARAIRKIVPEADHARHSSDVWSSVSEESARMIFGNDIDTTQSRLETFCKCAFSYYCRYILKLDEREEKHLEPVDVGNFVHSILERFFTRERVWELENEEREALVHSLTAEYVKEIFGDKFPPRLRYLTERLEKSVNLFCRSMSEEFAQSDFRPFALEQNVGIGEDSPPPYEISLPDGSCVRVRGIIDRLDLMRKDGRAYIRVVDYKTGAKKLSDADIRFGINTQLFLYLFAVWKCPPCDFRSRLLGDCQEIVPAGAMYFSARPGEASSPSNLSFEDGLKLAESSVVRSGKFLADGEVLRSMDRELRGKYIPVKELKNGTFTKNAAIPAEGFEDLRREIGDALSAAARGMKEGNSASLPLKRSNSLPCDYCPMMPICRNTDGKCRKY